MRKNMEAEKLEIVERAIFKKIIEKSYYLNKDKMLYNRTREEFVLLYDILSFL